MNKAGHEKYVFWRETKRETERERERERDLSTKIVQRDTTVQ